MNPDDLYAEDSPIEVRPVGLFERVPLEERRGYPFTPENEPLPVRLPMRAYQGDAGYDFYAPNHVRLTPLKPVQVWTGIRANLPRGYAALFQERSSHGKLGVMTLANVIDEGYKGELSVVLVLVAPPDQEPVWIEAGERLAQLVLFPRFVDSGEPFRPVRGTGGFGSSGK